MALLWLVSCGRTPLEGDTLASASGRASGSDDATHDDGNSYDGPSIPDDDDDGADVGGGELPPPDDPVPDFGSQLPPATCAMAPPLPAGPSCADAPARQLLELEGWNATSIVDDDRIYVAVTFWESSFYRIDKCTGDVELLGPAGMNPAELAIVDDRLLWTDYINPGYLWEMPKHGGDAVVIAELTQPLALVVAGDWIFYSANEGLFRMPKAGGASELFIGPERWYAYLTYDGALLFGNEGIVPSVGWIDPSDGTYGGIPTLQQVGDVLADCEWIFWPDEYGRLQRFSRATGTTENLDLPIYRMTHDATHVFASTGESTLVAIDKGTGDAVVVADLPGQLPWRSTVDETHVYWTFADSGDLWMAPKPPR